MTCGKLRVVTLIFRWKSLTNPSEICRFVVDIDVTVPFPFTEREPERNRKSSSLLANNYIFQLIVHLESKTAHITRWAYRTQKITRWELLLHVFFVWAQTLQDGRTFYSTKFYVSCFSILTYLLAGKWCHKTWGFLEYKVLPSCKVWAQTNKKCKSISYLNFFGSCTPTVIILYYFCAAGLWNITPPL